LSMFLRPSDGDPMQRIPSLVLLRFFMPSGTMPRRVWGFGGLSHNVSMCEAGLRHRVRGSRSRWTVYTGGDHGRRLGACLDCPGSPLQFTC